MPFCPHCGQRVSFGDTMCASCRTDLPSVIAQGAMPTQRATPLETIPAETLERWLRFESRDGSFSVEHPEDWVAMDSPISEAAVLSCVGPDRHTLLEVFAFEWDGPAAGGPDLVSVLADGIVETLGQETGHSNAHLISRRTLDFKNAACSRVLLSYRDRGLETTTDYCVIGTQDRALQIALKVLAQEYERLRPVFERILGTLRTPWLQSGECGNDN